MTQYGVAIMLTVAALCLWGFGHRLYSALLPELAAALQLSPRQTGMAGFVVALGYFAMALPTAFISRNFGCKLGVLIGLGTIAIGMFLFRPAMEQHSYVLVLLGAGVIGSGLAIIQITVAPLLIFLGPPDSAILRMNIAHAFTPLSEVCGIWLGQRIVSDALSKSASAITDNLMLPLSAIGIGAIVLAFVIELAKFPAGAVARSGRNQSTWASFRPPLRHARFRFGVSAAFFSLLAQVAVGSVSLRFCQNAMPVWSPAVIPNWYVFGLMAFAAGRFVGSALMFRFDPTLLLVVFCVASALASAVAIIMPGMIGISAFIVASFFLSIQLPTIVAYAIRDLGDAAKSAVAIIMFVGMSGTAVVGVGLLLTATLNVHVIMILPALCFVGTTLCVHAMRRAEVAETFARDAMSVTA